MIALALLAVFVTLALYAVGMQYAREGAQWGAWVASLASLVAAAGALFLTIGAFVVSSLKCDESCSDHAARWRQSATAWQWDVMFLFAIGGFVATSVFVAFTIRRQYGKAGCSLLVALALFALWGAFLATGRG
jgi:hypothetical protein